jgi:hypothetical protein
MQISSTYNGDNAYLTEIKTIEADKTELFQNYLNLNKLNDSGNLIADNFIPNTAGTAEGSGYFQKDGELMIPKSWQELPIY